MRGLDESLEQPGFNAPLCGKNCALSFHFALQPAGTFLPFSLTPGCACNPRPLQSLQRRSALVASAESELLYFLPAGLSLFDFARRLITALHEVIISLFRERDIAGIEDARGLGGAQSRRRVLARARQAAQGGRMSAKGFASRTEVRFHVMQWVQGTRSRGKGESSGPAFPPREPRVKYVIVTNGFDFSAPN
jgi:hypothetical protein